MSPRRLALAIVASAAAALVGAFAAGAKEGVKATLATKIPLHAPAGAQLKVAWTLWSLNEAGRREPFGAGDVFVRLRSASGDASEEAFASVASTGDYEATVRVPQGGIGAVQIGLRGMASGPNGTHRADVLFPITNNPAPPAIIASPAPSEPGASSSTWILSLIIAALAALAAVAVVAVVRKQRRRAASTVTT